MKKFLYYNILLLASAGLISCGTNKNSGEDKKDEDPINLDNYPNYVENYDSLTYDFNDANLSNPFWKGNVIYNESVLLTLNSETGEISGNLMFKPLKIISVKDYTLKTTDYELNKDYTLDGNKIIRTENSSIDYRTDDELTGKELPATGNYRYVETITNQLTDLVKFAGGTIYTESPFYYGCQIYVSYVYDIKDIDSSISNFPTYDMEKLPKLSEKFKNKEKIKIVGLGDSVLEGCSSSKKFNHEPFMDNFLDLTGQNLERLTGCEIEINNLSVGGKESTWGCQDAQINGIINAAPDLLFLHFGINDLGANRSSMIYSDNMETIVLKVKEALPNCEIILLSPFGPNPIIYDYTKLDEYIEALEYIESNYSGVKFIDIFKLSQIMCGNKKYLDMSANGINHVNDYASRIYLQAILVTLYKY